MNIKDLKIGVQIMLAFAALLVFVLILGAVSYSQTNQIYKQTELLYYHPIKVNRAIGRLEYDILNMRMSTRDLMLARNPKEKQDAIQLMELSSADALKQFDVIEQQYLGSPADIDDAYKAFTSWKTARQENTMLALSGKNEKVKERLLSTSTEEIYREQMMVKIKKIDDFAVRKADTLFSISGKLKDTLNRQLILLVTTILLLSLIISLFLLRNIRKPLKALSDATNRFHEGDMNSRCLYQSKNEFGELSASFNTLTERIQETTDLSEKAAKLAGLMLSEYDLKKFFQITINTLAAYTNSQMAAVYLLSDDKKTYEYFESTGLSDGVRQSFVANSFEGEFGAVLFSRKVQHLKNIPKDTRFVFHTVSGKFIPNEIITLPILINNEVIAIISLASVGVYSKLATRLVNRILITLPARLEGIITFHKMQELLKKLEIQNIELETQKTELSSQSTELIEQNIELEVQKKQLGEANQLKTNFLSNMSHELRTPLNSVIALSGVLNRRLVNQIPVEEYGFLEVIERNGKHLLSLINDILDISRIEAGREEIEITKFSMTNLISEVVSMIHPQAQQKNIELFQTTGDSTFLITCDTEKCRHILQNLIANAVKFTEKGKVEVAVKQSTNTINVSITDTGIGISENHLPHIFDEFRQADGSTSRRFGGTGLGLAIAKKYAHLLGGTITVVSSPGNGSEFTLILPLHYSVDNRIIEEEAAEDLKYSIRQTTKRPTSGSSVKTILLVEDSEPAIIQIKDILEESGHQILIARNGGEALEIIAHTIPDAMILDLMMPGIGGFKVLITLREAEVTAHVPVLILTAKHITKEELKLLKRNNIHQLIQKGDVNRSELLEAVSTMVFPDMAEIVIPQNKRQTIEGKPVILVVEDNPDNMITVKALLSDYYTVIEAIDGKEGVSMASKHKPNLILMDIELPGMDGIKAYKTIRKNTQLQHIPIIALTASAMTSDREAILSHGFDAYIAKPIDEPSFFKTINETLYGK